MSEVLDYFSPKVLATIRAFGTTGIARYLTNSSSDPRQITKQEVTDAHSLGLSVHFFYEMDPTYPAYFTFAQGAEDCRQAQARLAELGAPDGTVVYFTVDTNIEPSLTTEYFNGVESATTPRITPGVYGYQRMCEYARANYPGIGRHLWQTYGVPTVPLDGWQHLQEARAGVAVDVNDVTARGWKGTDMATAQEMWDNGLAAIVQEKVVAPLTDTDNAIKALVYAYESADQAAIAEAKTKVAEALERAALLLNADAAK